MVIDPASADQNVFDYDKRLVDVAAPLIADAQPPCLCVQPPVNMV